MGPPPWSERSGRWAAGSPVSARICRSYSDSISVLACCSPSARFIGIRFPRIRRLFRVLWNCPGSSKAGCTGDAPLGAILADPPLRYTPAAGCLPYGNIPFYFTHIAPPSRQDQTGYIIYEYRKKNNIRCRLSAKNRYGHTCVQAYILPLLGGFGTFAR